MTEFFRSASTRDGGPSMVTVGQPLTHTLPADKWDSTVLVNHYMPPCTKIANVR